MTKKKTKAEKDKAKKATKKLAASARQTSVPGTESKVPGPLKRMAEDYRNLRDQRMELSKLEGEAHDKLMGAMEASDMKRFVLDDTHEEVFLEHTDKVRVRKQKAPKES